MKVLFKCCQYADALGTCVSKSAPESQSVTGDGCLVGALREPELCDSRTGIHPQTSRNVFRVPISVVALARIRHSDFYDLAVALLE